MKNFIAFLVSGILIIPLMAHSSTLLQMYNNATAGLGYDKIIELEGDSVYLGGLSITNQKVAIRGQGAIIDLQGANISASGN